MYIHMYSRIDFTMEVNSDLGSLCLQCKLPREINQMSKQIKINLNGGKMVEKLLHQT